MGNIAIVQSSCFLYEIKKNLDLMNEIAYKAARQNAEIVVFPELFTTGYCINEKLFELAEPVNNSPSLSRLRETALKLGVSIITGFLERGEDDRYYNSAIVINNKGNILGVQRKVQLFGEEKKFYTPGNSLEVFDLPIGKIGIAICYDFEFPELTRILAMKKAEIIIAIAANMYPWVKQHETYLLARAMENQVFLVYANRVGIEGSLKFCGRSGAASPEGKIIISAGEEETVLLCKIDTNLIEKARRSDTSYLNHVRVKFYTSMMNSNS